MFFNVVLKIDIDFIDAFMYLLYRALLSHVAYLISLHTYTHSHLGMNVNILVAF